MNVKRNDILTNIIEIRKEKGISQEYLSSKIGLKQSGYGLIERGERVLTYEKLVQIALVFKMDVVNLIVRPEELVQGNVRDCENCQKKDEIIQNLNEFIQILKQKIKKQ